MLTTTHSQLIVATMQICRLCVCVCIYVYCNLSWTKVTTVVNALKTYLRFKNSKLKVTTLTVSVPGGFTQAALTKNPVPWQNGPMLPFCHILGLSVDAASTLSTWLLCLLCCICLHFTFSVNHKAVTKLNVTFLLQQLIHPVTASLLTCFLLLEHQIVFKMYFISWGCAVFILISLSALLWIHNCWEENNFVSWRWCFFLCWGLVPLECSFCTFVVCKCVVAHWLLK